jgi:putative acetyltransferase
MLIRPLQPEDADAARQLILAGLGQRFGAVDTALNPDLNTLWDTYSQPGTVFLVAEADGRIVGCGALIPEAGADNTARIVRVSVAADVQGRGLGRRISQALLDSARAQGIARVLVETNADWDSALRLYQALGFREERREINNTFGFVEVHMALDLDSGAF